MDLVNTLSETAKRLLGGSSGWWALGRLVMGSSKISKCSEVCSHSSSVWESESMNSESERWEDCSSEGISS